MDDFPTEAAAGRELGRGDLFAEGLRGIEQAEVKRPLRCVWTNHPSHDQCCRAGIPASVVAAAWDRERERASADRFFHFAWRGGVWLAYGLRDGNVRGVYCPAHSAARDARSFTPEEAYPVALTA